MPVEAGSRGVEAKEREQLKVRAKEQRETHPLWRGRPHHDVSRQRKRRPSSREVVRLMGSHLHEQFSSLSCSLKARDNSHVPSSPRLCKRGRLIPSRVTSLPKAPTAVSHANKKRRGMTLLCRPDRHLMPKSVGGREREVEGQHFRVEHERVTNLKTLREGKNEKEAARETLIPVSRTGDRMHYLTALPLVGKGSPNKEILHD